MGSTVNTEQIQELPLPIRDIFNLVNRVPGAFRSESNANISIGGGRTHSAGSFIDGAFEVPDPNTLGNAGRTLPGIRVPSRMNFDVMLGKNACWGERWRASFHWEACNFTNTPALNFRNTALGNGSFGTVTATLPNSRRIMQVGLRITFRPSAALSLTGHRVGLT